MFKARVPNSVFAFALAVFAGTSVLLGMVLWALLKPQINRHRVEIVSKAELGSLT